MLRKLLRRKPDPILVNVVERLCVLQRDFIDADRIDDAMACGIAAGYIQVAAGTHETPPIPQPA
jgi:hypothetical protein